MSFELDTIEKDDAEVIEAFGHILHLRLQERIAKPRRDEIWKAWLDLLELLGE